MQSGGSTKQVSRCQRRPPGRMSAVLGAIEFIGPRGHRAERVQKEARQMQLEHKRPQHDQGLVCL